MLHTNNVHWKLLNSFISIINDNNALFLYFSTIQYTSERFGKFDLFIGLFKQDTLSTAVQPNDAIDVLKTIYARLKLESSSGSLKMAVQSCIATPHNTPPDNATYTHDLINSRSVCPILLIHSFKCFCTLEIFLPYASKKHCQ